MAADLSTSVIDTQPESVARLLGGPDRRVLLIGQPGVGKSTLAYGLAEHLGTDGRSLWCLNADPGSPAFGVPGALSLARWAGFGWTLMRMVALCTLDAGRFRLPLVEAAHRLATEVTEGTLLIDAPGTVRSVAGAELLHAMARATEVDIVLAILREGQSLPLTQELSALGVETVWLRAHRDAQRPGKTARARRRTAQWDEYLSDGKEHHVGFEDIKLLGTPPPPNTRAEWKGRQVAFLDRERTLVMGEVTDTSANSLRIRLPPGAEPSSTLLVRDACRAPDGLLGTARPFAEGSVRYIPPTDLLPPQNSATGNGPRPVVLSGILAASLVNGVFGDPLLHVRLRHQRRSLLFDLGEGSRLPARIAHQVTDVFITHSHIDHIAGFLWLLRSRIGDFPTCRIFGPPGIANNIEGLLHGICWDRVADRGPVFEVGELIDDRLSTFRMQAGKSGRVALGCRRVENGIIQREADFQIRAVTLDHGTPVLAFAFEAPLQIKVRKDRLEALGLEPGPWLSELKRVILSGRSDHRILLPSGSEQSVSKLADDLVMIAPGQKLAYATDFADTPKNRRCVIELAANSHTFFCESTFLESDAAQARNTGHLTTRGCGEIAKAAKVTYLVPFHFSRRYEDDPSSVYEEIAAVCPQVVKPKLSEKQPD